MGQIGVMEKQLRSLACASWNSDAGALLPDATSPSPALLPLAAPEPETGPDLIRPLPPDVPGAAPVTPPVAAPIVPAAVPPAIVPAAAPAAIVSEVPYPDHCELDWEHFDSFASLRDAVPGLLDVWCVTTDAGPDIAGARKRIQEEVYNHPWRWLYDCDCLLHQYHLISYHLTASMTKVMEALGIQSGGSGYYSCLAMLMHIWRDNALDAFHFCLKHYGIDDAMELFSKLPPRPLSGRWGRKSACEQRVSAESKENWQILTHVLTEVIGARGYYRQHLEREAKEEAAAAQAEREAEPGADHPPEGKGGGGRRGGRGRGGRGKGRGIDEMAQDTSEAWTTNMGKWADKAVKLLQQPAFRLAILISFTMSKELDHLFLSLMKKRPGITNLAHLVYGGAARIRSGLVSLARSDTWDEVLDRAPIARTAKLRQAIQSVALSVIGSYDRRITARIESWPLQLLLLARQDWNAPCQERRKLCRKILKEDAANLHINVRKLLFVFRPEIKQCALSDADEGRISACVWTPFQLLRTRWRGDTQEVEGIMNLILNATSRSPSLNLDLLDARIGVRKSLGMGSRDCTVTKWSDIEDRANRAVDDVAPFFRAADGIMAPSRWKAALPCRREIVLRMGRIDPLLAKNPAITWAAWYNKQWRSDVSKNPALRDGCALVEFIHDGAIVEAWMCVNIMNLLGTFLPMQLALTDNVEDGGEAGAVPGAHGKLVAIVGNEEEWPTAKSSVRLFESFYEKVMSTEKPVTVAYRALDWNADAEGICGHVMDDERDLEEGAASADGGDAGIVALQGAEIGAGTPLADLGFQMRHDVVIRAPSSKRKAAAAAIENADPAAEAEDERMEGAMDAAYVEALLDEDAGVQEDEAGKDSVFQKEEEACKKEILKRCAAAPPRADEPPGVPGGVGGEDDLFDTTLAADLGEAVRVAAPASPAPGGIPAAAAAADAAYRLEDCVLADWRSRARSGLTALLAQQVAVIEPIANSVSLVWYCDRTPNP